nr:hypothetical protein pmam_307 [Pithovirus mammoth]
MSSLFSLILNSLPFDQVVEICNSGQFPPCDWAERAKIKLGIPPEFFNLYLSRPISGSYRYLELTAISHFLPQFAVSANLKTGKIFGLMESVTGILDAISKGNSEQLRFFFPRVKREIMLELASKLWLGNSQFTTKILYDSKKISISTLKEFFILAGISSPIEENQSLRIQFHDRDHFGYSIDFPDQVIIQNGDIEQIPNTWSKSTILHRMVENGNVKALEQLVPLGLTKRLLHSILRSGRMDFLEKFLPLDKKFSGSFFSEEEYYAASHGGNPQMLDFLFSQNDLRNNEEVDWEDMSEKILREAITGFFIHRNLPSTYTFLTKLPLVQSYFPYSLSEGLPIDLIELILNLPTPKYSDRINFSILLEFLKCNLGYINTVFFLLDKIDSDPQISSGIDYVDQSERENFFYDIEHRVSFYPLSVRLIQSRSSGWKTV